MNSDSWLKQAISLLEKHGIVTARLDALILMEDVMKRDRSYLLSHPELPLTNKQVAILQSSIEKRCQHTPLAYIRYKTEFYGREFYINNNVLEPRPESEAIVELVLSLLLPDKAIVADVGSGSGALGITVALELPNTQVDLFDIDVKALAVSAKNMKQYNLVLGNIYSDLLTESKQDYDVIIANLPYVPDNFQLNNAAMMEPKLAIFGGKDGLDVYRKLFKQLRSQNKPTKYVITEALPFQHAELANLALKCGYHLTRTNDFVQLYTVQN